MLLGKYDQNWVCRPWFPVDVRGDANCHIGLLESTEVDNGDRFIAGSTDAMDVAGVCAKIDKVLPELSFEVSESVEIHPKKGRCAKKSIAQSGWALTAEMSEYRQLRGWRSSPLRILCETGANRLF